MFSRSKYHEKLYRANWSSGLWWQTAVKQNCVQVHDFSWKPLVATSEPDKKTGSVLWSWFWTVRRGRKALRAWASSEMMFVDTGQNVPECLSCRHRGWCTPPLQALFWPGLVCKYGWKLGPESHPDCHTEYTAGSRVTFCLGKLKSPFQ